MNTLNVDDPALRDGIVRLLDYHLAPHMPPKQINAAVGELLLMLDCAAHRPQPARRIVEFLDHWGDDKLHEVIARKQSSGSSYAELTVTDLRAVLAELDELREAAQQTKAA